MNHVLKVKIDYERDWTWVTFTNWAKRPSQEIKNMQVEAVAALKGFRPQPRWARNRIAWYFKKKIERNLIMDVLKDALEPLNCATELEQARAKP